MEEVVEQTKIFDSAEYESIAGCHAALNQWLSKHPLLEIVGRTQSGGDNRMIVQIWYK